MEGETALEGWAACHRPCYRQLLPQKLAHIQSMQVYRSLHLRVCQPPEMLHSISTNINIFVLAKVGTCRQNELLVCPQVERSIGFMPNLQPRIVFVVAALQDAREVDKVDIGRAWKGPQSLS